MNFKLTASYASFTGLSDPKFAPSTSSLASSQPPGKAWGLLKYKQWICEWNFSTRKQLMNWTQYNLELSIYHFVCQQIFLFINPFVSGFLGIPFQDLCVRRIEDRWKPQRNCGDQQPTCRIFSAWETPRDLPHLRCRVAESQSFMHQLDPSQLTTRPYL